MDVVSPADTALRLPYPALAEALAAILAAKRERRAAAPERLHLALPGGGVLLVMPAADEEIAMTKLATVHPANAAAGLPTLQGEVVVMEAVNGRRLGILDGPALTARRTAALSLLAAKLLAPSFGPLLLVGAGTQARAHLEAFRDGLGLSEVFISSRTPESADTLASYATELGLKAYTVAHPADALPMCPLVVTATTSLTPVLPETVRDDAFIAAVGAYRRTMTELPPRLVQRCRLYADTLEGCRAEAGDLIQAHVDFSTVTPLEQALTLPRPDSGPVLFKSVGHALFDLAAAKLYFGR